MIEPATELHERVLSKIDSEYLSNHDKLLCDDIIATVKKTVAECIAGILDCKSELNSDWQSLYVSYVTGSFGPNDCDFMYGMLNSAEVENV